MHDCVRDRLHAATASLYRSAERRAYDGCYSLYPGTFLVRQCEPGSVASGVFCLVRVHQLADFLKTESAPYSRIGSGVVFELYCACKKFKMKF